MAMSFGADPLKTSYALRANARWHQGNLLGAQKDLSVAQEAVQAVQMEYAKTMCEVCCWSCNKVYVPKI